jgi:Icc-related predicted phosphoesterase
MVNFIPLFLFGAGLVLWTGFQTTMLITEKRNLETVKTNQENTIQQALKLRTQLDSIAAKTQILAEKGNTGAKTIVDELKKRGVTINPNASPTAPAAPAK